MSAVELALEKVRAMDEEQAARLLAWLGDPPPRVQAQTARAGARSLLGFARRYRETARPTSEWMMELREGDRD